MFKSLLLSLIVLTMFACSNQSPPCTVFVESKNEYIFDATRNRQIPTQHYFLSDPDERNGELVILSAGYGSSNTEYEYITKELAQKGYYVISIQHELQTDEMLPSGEDMIAARTPNWEEGVKSIHQVLKYAKKMNPAVSKSKIHLVGHSNGGDISILFANKNPKKVSSLITLDHRRMPIPLTKEFTILSLRADQFEADTGVIPSSSDQKKYGIEIIYLKNVDHNYLLDIATKETKSTVVFSIFEFLNLTIK